MMTSTRCGDVAGGRRQAGAWGRQQGGTWAGQQAGTWGDVARPLRQSGDKTQVLCHAGSGGTAVVLGLAAGNRRSRTEREAGRWDGIMR